MGNYSLLLVLAAAVAISTLVLSARSSTMSSDRELARHVYKSVIAREAAATGLNLTIRRLVSDTARWSNDPSIYQFTRQPYGNAKFTTLVAAPYSPGPRLDECTIDTVDVTSIGFPDADTTGQRNHRIEATYVRTCRQEIRSGSSGYYYYAYDPVLRKMVGRRVEPEDTVIHVPSGLRLLSYAEW